MGKHIQVAHIASHFHINRNIHDPNTGPVTLAEQVLAVERFVRWHERQVEVGQKLLAQLKAAEAAEAPTPEAVPA